MTLDLANPFLDPYPETIPFLTAFELFDAWYDAAKPTELNDPNAMYLATVDSDGAPSVRTVLLKEHDSRGFVFYTNFQGRKGRELLETPTAALLFHWKSQQRQVRIEGSVETVSDEDADAYYNSRHRLSRLGAWASDQSRTLDSRATLAARVEAFDQKFAGQETFPRPAHWSGFRIIPKRIEFWQDGEGRLHDRMILEPTSSYGSDWSAERQYP